MKKTSVIVKEKEMYEMSQLIQNTALIRSKSGKTGILNIKNNQVIGELDYYYTIYDPYEKFYIQRKEIKEINQDGKEHTKYMISIYDALNEKFIAEGLEVVHWFEEYYRLVSLKSTDGKIHLFDKTNCRNSLSIFNRELENVEFLYSYYSNYYYVVTKDGKKGFYQKEKGMQTSIEYDSIERNGYITIYTKNGKKQFECDKKKRILSIEFDEITVDSENKRVVYCKKGNKIYIYQGEEGELLLEQTCEEAKLTRMNTDNWGYGDYAFKIKQNEKWGVFESYFKNVSKKSNDLPVEVKQIIPSKYDEIEYGRNSNCYYVKQNQKIGLFKNRITINPSYDDIDYVGEGFYAFYMGKLCSIGKVEQPFNPVVTRCQIVKNSRNGLIYQKGNHFGLLMPSTSNHEDVILSADYDSITELNDEYFQLEQNGKKGVFYNGEMIIPVEYEQIMFKRYHPGTIDKSNMVYFALQNKNQKYELAKRKDYDWREDNTEFVKNHTFDRIQFLEDIMVLKDEQFTYIYDYEEKLLRTYSINVDVSAVLKDPKQSYKGYFYIIDGVYYFYEKGKFEKATMADLELYITTYETDKDSFEAKTFSKKEHDRFCADIDSLTEEDAEKSLLEMSENDNVKKKYRTLVLTRTPKQRNE